VCKPLLDACAALKWSHPTPIQVEALPLALSGRDVIGLAETGSGKTGAFAIPVIQALLDRPQRLFACIMVPTRELAFQIAEQFDALGSAIGCKSAVLVGGVDMMSQAIALARKPHIVIGTPGRVVDHLENTKGFSLRAARYLVLDEADRMLSLDFEEAIDKVLRAVPRERRTLLFSATMTSRVAKLQRASLLDPVKVEVSTKYSTASGLVQRFILCPHKHKDAHLVALLNDFSGQSAILFVATCAGAQRLALTLKNLGFSTTSLHSKLSQSRRLGALNSFRVGEKKVLVATDVVSRGLDLPSVDMVVNVDVPASAKDYIHRVGRTARAGRGGNAVTMVTQYDLEVYQRVERLLDKKLPEYEQNTDEIRAIVERVNEAARMAAAQLKEASGKMYGSGKGGQRRAAMAAAEADLAAGDGFAGAESMLAASSAQRRRMGDAVRARKGGKGRR
jgi:ATP-dependent RNA helicase DDX47/RRP3